MTGWNPVAFLLLIVAFTFAVAFASALPAAATPPVMPLPGDEALLPHLERAEIACRGKILSFPRGKKREDAPTKYRVDHLVYDVLKGDDDIQNRILRVDIERYEADPRNPEITAGKKKILLLRKLDHARAIFTTVDPWFGTLPDNPRLADAIRTLSGKVPGTAEAEIYRKR